MLRETSPGSNKFYVIDKNKLHLGGNITGGDINCWTPKVWDWLVTQYQVQRVLDVGCGEGQTLDYFKSLGCKTFGLEGLPKNVKSIKKGSDIFLWDLTQGPVIVKGEAIDLVWCCEVVEHIDEVYMGNLLQTFANGQILAMTHALPGQPGWHHVNCKPVDYWVETLRLGGFEYLRNETLVARNLAPKRTFFNKTGLIFRRV